MTLDDIVRLTVQAFFTACDILLMRLGFDAGLPPALIGGFIGVMLVGRVKRWLAQERERAAA